MPSDPANGIKTLLEDEWEPAIPGRTTDVPDIVASTDDGTGVIVLQDDSSVRERLSTHDVINVQNVDNAYIMRGKDSEEIVDTVQIDIRISDRDIDADGLRESVRARMLGERDAANDADTLGGLRGEVRRILNGITKGWQEYDEVDYDSTIQYIRNTDARVTFTVEPRIIEQDRPRPL